jgi:cation:H+ antiporter
MDLNFAIVLFLISAAIIAVAGTMLAKVADQLADLTGMGEALFGAIFLGSATSLPGIITSVVAAADGHAELAISNAIGGIAAQTFFLSIADLSYPRANLEHAAASFPNLMQGVLLVALLSFVLLGMSTPPVTIFAVNPISILMLIVYVAGSRKISNARLRPMWRPRHTTHTVKDEPNPNYLKKLNLSNVAIRFIILVVAVGSAGFAVAKSGIAIVAQTALSESFVGAIFTAVATSLPELIVSIALVRQRALTLAVGNIIGGNTFDVLFIAFADVAYRDGSILHAISNSQVLIIALTLLMTSTLILGLLIREKKGIGKIGWESFLVILLYLAGNVTLYFMGE